jgi:replicative DNA helicase
VIAIKDVNELCDIQSEAGIIATLINHPDYVLYSDKLKQESFFDETNGCLFQAISKLFNNGIETIDTYNLNQTIKNDQSLSRFLDKDFTKDQLAEIINYSIHISRNSAQEYNGLVESVLGYAFKRKIFRELEKSKIRCFDNKMSISDLHSEIQSSIDEVTVNYVSQDIKPYKDIVEKLWEETKARFSVVSNGYGSKFSRADEYFVYEPNELVLLSAKRKKGKSIFSLNELVDKVTKGIGVLYIDTELDDRLFNERLLAHFSKVEFKDLKRGNFSKEQEKDIEKAVKYIKTLNFYHIRMTKWDKDQIYLLAKKLKRTMGLTFLIYDHLKTTESKDTGAAYHELGNKVNFLKDTICGELGYAGLCLAQLNRSGDIGDSFKLEQEVSTVLNLEKKTEEEIMRDGRNCGNYKLFVKANRNGTEMDDIADEYIDLMFYGNICNFTQAEQHKRKETPFEESDKE